MGVVDTNSYTALVRFSSEADFRPIFLSGVHCIGIPNARESARKFLLDEEGNIKSGENLDPNPDIWAMKVAVAIDKIIQTRTEPSVGGHVQLVVGDKNGWREVSVSVLREGVTGDIGSDDWRDASCSLSSLIPTGEDLAKIMRYEAHLNRQLYQAMHELEALNARRQGQAAPLARIDLQASAET